MWLVTWHIFHASYRSPHKTVKKRRRWNKHISMRMATSCFVDAKLAISSVNKLHLIVLCQRLGSTGYAMSQVDTYTQNNRKFSYFIVLVVHKNCFRCWLCLIVQFLQRRKYFAIYVIWKTVKMHTWKEPFERFGNVHGIHVISSMCQIWSLVQYQDGCMIAKIWPLNLLFRSVRVVHSHFESTKGIRLNPAVKVLPFVLRHVF